MVQVPEQPSPLLVLPSSHFSVPAMMPSPHTTCGQTHFCPGTQMQLAPITLQLAEQPSPSVILPSSHTSPSATCTIPSPQRGALMHGEPGAAQTQPCSSWQVAPQPSFAAMLPSSQFSPCSTRLLPQIEVSTQGLPAMQT